MIIPKRKAEDYTPPAIINEYDQIFVYVQQKKNLAQIKELMAGKLDDAKIERMYLNVLRDFRKAKDRHKATIMTGFILLGVGIWLIFRNLQSILQQMQQKRGDENLYVNSSFFEFKHPFWLLVFGTMAVIGFILLITNAFKKIKI
ncbi:MAG: hypothetical protein OHK0045_00520 [Raineya sp.]